MRTKLTQFWQTKYPLFLSFFIPVIIMLTYFISRGMSPFGKSSLLTVDLGQQYIDFFAYFRRALLHDPSSFFYSFSKEIGGSMIGEWAYYLMSPFNLIFLFFPQKTLPAGIMLVTLVKYGCVGLTFCALLRKKMPTQKVTPLLFSTCYALMGWFVANQLNLLWLDAAIFLPLVILALDSLLQQQNNWHYPVLLAVLLIDNYYMGYMVCIFLVAYFFWYLTTKRLTLRENAALFLRFALNSLLGVGLAAIILLPTAFSLIESKGQYTQNFIHFKFEYAPLKMLSKFIVGAFNFQQMPSGYPNLFIGSLALIGFLTYFLNAKIGLRERLAALLISIFLFLSLCFEPLDLFWHGMQFPVWYPYRFSFIVSFWMLLLAARSLRATLHLEAWKVWLCFLLFASSLTYLLLNIKKFSFISNETLLFTAVFATLTLATLAFTPKPKYARVKFLWLFVLVTTEITLNACLSLNNLSYLTAKEYTQPTTALMQDSSYLNKRDHAAYRTGQVYSRTKNDGIANSLNTGSYFSSALEKSIPDFYGMIGNPDGDNYVTYSNGTMITDSLLNMKYFSAPKAFSELKNGQPLQQLTEKPDLKAYKMIKSNSLTRLYQNKSALGYAYLADTSLKSFSGFYDNPLEYQTQWLNNATGTKGLAYFTAQNFNEVVFQNISQQTKLTNTIFRRKDLTKDGQIIFKFTPTTNDSYYLTLGPSLDEDNVTWYLNNRQLNQYGTFRHAVVVNLANHAKGQEIVLTAKLKKSSLWLNNFVLYRMNNAVVSQKLATLKNRTVKLTQKSQRKFEGYYEAKNNRLLLATTIPYSKGWHVLVDGKSVPTFKVQNTFLAIKAVKGRHTLKLTFTPPYFVIGCLISGLSILIVVYLSIRPRFNKRRRWSEKDL
ncbi:YfhO family protein [Liquorilactobacillus satsumensis]|uniref:Integral membrane protein n=1 Tax=Liquorilactobacillus satsumensis DSM 16230 = JCM 12392 TaxID=1423801 RepID=A0A0R1V7G6_9LACO|nr:YfhO family protein [Liquorilactobacillus satsumensis]KRL99866.1 hypothetical protein FD50_GL002402 [Liquorilactobacillus satsumensis DSM 16230 = JCM 12392]